MASIYQVYMHVLQDACTLVHPVFFILSVPSSLSPLPKKNGVRLGDHFVSWFLGTILLHMFIDSAEVSWALPLVLDMNIDD